MSNAAYGLAIFALAISALAISGCSDPATNAEPDARPRHDASAPIDGPASDGSAPRSDASTGSDDASARSDDASIAIDGSAACEPIPGPMSGSAYCELFELAIFGTGTAREARLFGRVSAGDGCTVLDEVEVLEDGASVTTA